jgi:hypothetical protein
MLPTLTDRSREAGVYSPEQLEPFLHNDELNACCIYGWIHAWLENGAPAAAVGDTVRCVRGHERVAYLADGKWGSVDLLDVASRVRWVYDGHEVREAA